MPFTIQDVYYYTKNDVRSITLNNFTSLEKYKREDIYNNITLIELNNINTICITDLKNKIGKSLEDIAFHKFYMVWCRLKDNEILEISNKKQCDMINYCIIYSREKLDITQRHINRLNRHITRNTKLSRSNPIIYDNRPHRYFDYSRSSSPKRAVNSKTNTVDMYSNKRRSSRSRSPLKVYRGRSRSRSPYRESKIRHRHLDRSPRRVYRDRGLSRSPVRENRNEVKSGSPDTKNTINQPLLSSPQTFSGGYTNLYPTNISSVSQTPPLMYNSIQQQHIQSLQDLHTQRFIIEKELEIQKLQNELAKERSRNFEHNFEK